MLLQLWQRQLDQRKPQPCYPPKTEPNYLRHPLPCHVLNHCLVACIIADRVSSALLLQGHWCAVAAMGMEGVCVGAGLRSELDDENEQPADCGVGATLLCCALCCWQTRHAGERNIH